MRHTQKDTLNSHIDDYDIKLTPMGCKETKLIALRLKEKNILPDLITASPAIRARQTAHIVAMNINYIKNIVYNKVLYEAFLNEIIELITSPIP